MMEVNQVCAYAETMVKQLEALAYSKNAALGAKLVGGIEVCINIAQVNADSWNRRTQIALGLVMEDAPKASGLTLEMPASISAAAKNQVPQKQSSSLSTAPLIGEAGLPQIENK